MTKTPEDYTDRITQFHFYRDRYRAEVGAVVSAPVQVGETAASLSEAFDLDTAVGVQLDAVGKWVGRDRFVPYPLSTFWFSFDDFLRGWDMAAWQGAYDADYGLYRLGDDDFRALLYAQIGLNYWDGTTESLDDTLITFYTSRNHDATSLFFFQNRGDLSAELDVAGTWPSPMVMAMLAWPALRVDIGGIEFKTQVTSISGTPLFGFDITSNLVSGWDVGSWGVDPSTLLDQRGTPGELDFSDPDNSGLIGGAT